MSNRGASKPRPPQPVYDESYAKRAKQATQQAMDKRKGR